MVCEKGTEKKTKIKDVKECHVVAGGSKMQGIGCYCESHESERDT